MVNAIVVIGILLVLIAILFATSWAIFVPVLAQTDVKTIDFTTIVLNITEDGAIRNVETSQQTINGTNEQLRESFAQLINQSEYQSTYTTFINENEKTAQVFGAGQATPNVFNNWFNATLTQMDQNLEAKGRKVWITICDTQGCATTHSTLTPTS